MAKRRSSKKSASPWIKHVKSVAKSKGISYKDALKIAGKTYTKKHHSTKKHKGSKKRSKRSKKH